MNTGQCCGWGLLLTLFLLLSACFVDDHITPEEQLQIDLDNVDKEQLELDIALIDTFLTENEIEAIEHETGLRYVLHEEGEGISPQLADNIRVNYLGTMLEESDPFDADDNFFYPLGDLILGWRIGFPLLQEGDSATFYIPSVYGYGNVEDYHIPPNSNLVFVMRLIDVERF